MKPENSLDGAVGRIDRVIRLICKGYSYLGVVAILIMSFLAVGDILAAKLFSSAIPQQHEWIQYMLLAVVFCFLPIIVLGRGMMSVDILTRKFPKLLLSAIEIVSYACGAVIFGFLAYRGFLLVARHFVEKTTSATQTGAFQIWPFTLIYAAGQLLLAVACLWRAVRTGALAKAAPKTTEKGEGKS